MIAVARSWQERERTPERDAPPGAGGEAGRGVRPALKAVAAPERALQLPLIPEDAVAAPGPDKPPELTHYRDEGCRFWHACLSCPFPRCLFEEPKGARSAMNAYRDGEIRRMYAAGRPAAEIAEHFAITRRSVYRVLGGVRRQGVSGESGVGGRGYRVQGRSHVPRRG